MRSNAISDPPDPAPLLSETPSTGPGRCDDSVMEAMHDRIAKLVSENERLAEVVSARDSFLAVAAHELKNALTPVVARVEILRRQLALWPLAKIEASLIQIEQATGIFARRATTLLDVSRMAAGKLELDKAKVEVAALTTAICENFGPLADRARCELTVDVPDPDLAVLGDEQALGQIVDNLVSNALKYCPGAPIHVTASMVGEFVHLEIADGGPGISHDAHMRIFERFERAVRPSEAGGFGVGLWVVKQLSEAMGGEVRVTSSPGAGSVFCVVLPGYPGAANGR